MAEQTFQENTTQGQQGQQSQQGHDLREELVSGYHELEHQLQSTREKAHEINQQAVQLIKERPVVALAGAFGMGYLIGKLASRRWLV